MTGEAPSREPRAPPATVKKLCLLDNTRELLSRPFGSLSSNRGSKLNRKSD